jgi:hypothetical protein
MTGPAAERPSSPSGLIRATGEPRLWLRSADGSISLLRRPLTEAEAQHLIETGKAKLVNGKGGRYLAAVISERSERVSAPCMAPATTEPVRVDGHKTTGLRHRGELATGRMMIDKPKRRKANDRKADPRRPEADPYVPDAQEGHAVLQPHAPHDLDDWFGPKPAGRPPRRRRSRGSPLIAADPAQPGRSHSLSVNLLPGWASAPEATCGHPHIQEDPNHQSEPQ